MSLATNINTSLFMKKLVSLSLFLSLTFLSCSTDDNFETIESQSEVTNSLSRKENPNTWNPENTNNTYDIAGKLYLQILEEHAENSSTTIPAVIISEIESIANNIPQFVSMKNNNYSPLAYTNINWILASNNSYDTAFTNNTTLSIAAKNKLELLIDNLDVLLDSDATSKNIHDYIVGFEVTIVSSQTLTTADKKVILTSSSIARHANYLRKKGRRWDIHHGITGAVDGDDESMAKAVTTAACAHAIGNTGI